MNFIEICKNRFEKYNTVLCIGLDPIIEKIPLKNKSNIEKTLTKFYFSIVDSFNEYALAVKPNIAFYEQYGIDGYRALKKIVERCRKYDLPVILDCKRGDIGDTSKAYANAVFNDLKADAVTLSPYLGEDSLSPFFEFRDKGFFILNRTSNRGSGDFQLLELKNGNKLFMEVSKKILEWNKKYSSGIGAVAGATHPEELKTIADEFVKSGSVPILIPGVGKQGGDFNTIVGLLKSLNYDMHKVFINSSSKINYAYLDNPGMDYLEASLIEIKKCSLQSN